MAATARFQHVLVALLFAIVLVSSARAANETALLELWQQHTATPEAHEEVISACRSFATANAGDPLLPVVQGIEAWHHLRAGRSADGLRLMEPHLTAPAGPITDAARALARGWFTRFDREKVTGSLQAYYRKAVAFPKTLDQLANDPKLPADARPPGTDRFGKPWNYRLTGFKTVSGFGDQKYALQSDALSDLSDLKAALKIPYASRIQMTPVQIVPGPGNTVAVKLSGKSGPAIIGVGQGAGALQVAFAGAQIVVLCDHAHWKIFPKP